MNHTVKQVWETLDCVCSLPLAMLGYFSTSPNKAQSLEKNTTKTFSNNINSICSFLKFFSFNILSALLLSFI